uniref:Uncharacterized protein n=1 Tax=Parascaris equorum TaxID=6256 RepID=A0A914REW2_PAREQ
MTSTLISSSHCMDPALWRVTVGAIKAFNDDDPAIDISKLRDIGILCSAGARILNATTADDLKHFSPVRYDTVLLLMNMLKSEEFSDEILEAIVSFCSRIRNFSL